MTFSSSSILLIQQTEFQRLIEIIADGTETPYQRKTPYGTYMREEE